MGDYGDWVNDCIEVYKCFGAIHWTSKTERDSFVASITRNIKWRFGDLPKVFQLECFDTISV